MSEDNIYLMALEVLREDGWTKDSRLDRITGARCLVGALDAVCGHQLEYDDHLLQPLDQIVIDEFGMNDEKIFWCPSVDFNDLESTTFADIEVLLTKAAQR